MSKKSTQIHETVIKDILDLWESLKDEKFLDNIINRAKSGKSFRSIAAGTSNLILTFPVLCSRAISIERASLMSKALEPKFVSMLQILFSAIQIDDSSDLFGYLKNFHSNINTKAFDVSDAISIIDRISEDAKNMSDIEYHSIMNEAKKLIKEDMRNLDSYMESNINDISIGEFTVASSDQKFTVIREAKRNNSDNGKNEEDKLEDEYRNWLSRQQNSVKDDIYTYNDWIKSKGNNVRGIELDNIQHRRYGHPTLNRGANPTERLTIDKQNELERQQELQDREYSKQRDSLKDARDNAKNVRDELKLRSDLRKDAIDNKKANAEYFGKQVLNGEYKKANEIMPTMMTVSYKVIGGKVGDTPIEIASAVIGVKCKLYPLDSEDIVNRIKLKVGDRASLLQLFKATTREISFWKDFIFAIDRAKIDALSYSDKGSSSKMWKILERRAIKSRVKRSIGKSNDALAITTLIISQDEVEYIKKMDGIDLQNIKIARPLMESYNLIGLCIVDESLEVAKFLFDTGEDMWETLSFTNLEKEASDSTYKKVVNLMTKMR